MAIPLLYIFLLVDIFKRSKDLVNILKSITKNRNQLFYTAILTVIAVYMFAVTGFVEFADFYVSGPDSEYEA